MSNLLARSFRSGSCRYWFDDEPLKPFHNQRKVFQMRVKQLAAYLVGLFLFVRSSQARQDRGLTQSTENAILLAGAVLVAGIVITMITAFVRSKLPR